MLNQEEQLVRDHINLIRKIAWSFSRTTGLEWEELFGEAELALVYAIRSYNPEKCKLSTWIYKRVTSHLTTTIKKEKRHKNNVELHEEYGYGENTEESQLNMISIFDTLSPEATEVCQMILENPLEFLESSSKLSRGHVYRKLRKVGWPWEKIWSTFNEIREVLNVIR